MDIDDLEPVRLASKPKNLDLLSVEELQEYIARLEAEISRCREMIAKKGDARKAADSVFGN